MRVPSYQRETHSEHQLGEHLEEVSRVLQAISFGDGTNTPEDQNIDGVYIDVVTNAAPDTETTHTHTLGRTPVGFFVVNLDKGAVIYKSAAWSATEIKIKANVATVTAKLLLF
jgi:hypothetical protein